MTWQTKLIIGLLIFLPLYFAVAALGTKFGIWDFRFSLGTLIRTGGPIVLGAVGLVSLVLLLMALFKKPHGNWILPAIGVIVPIVGFVMLSAAGARGADNPIHDVSTDTGNPPEFSAETLAMREQVEANPLVDYQTPLGETEMYADADPELAIRNTAQIITDKYAELAPLPLAGATPSDGLAAVAAAMAEMGFADIRTDAAAGRVEGVAETFWFGFKDDVVARIGENQIDFRSVSRVGRSDLGANAERIEKLRELVAEKIGQR